MKNLIYSKVIEIISHRKKILFYIAGNGINSQHFVASAEIDELNNPKINQNDPNQEFKQVLFYVRFKNLKIFKKLSALL